MYQKALQSGKEFNFNNNKYDFINSDGTFKIQIEFDEVGNITNAYPLITI